MEGGSSSDSVEKHKRQKGGHTKTRLGSMFPKVEPFVPRNDHNPRELRSWAKRTGFISTFSGETATSVSDKFDNAGFDVERGIEHHRGGGSSPKIEIDPVLGRTRPTRGSEIEPDSTELRNDGAGRGEKERRRIRDEPVLVDKVDERLNGNGVAHVNGNRNGAVNGSGNEVPVVSQVGEKKEEEKFERDVQIDMYPGGEEAAHGGWGGQSGMRLGLRDNPGYG